MSEVKKQLKNIQTAEFKQALGSLSKTRNRVFGPNLEVQKKMQKQINTLKKQLLLTTDSKKYNSITRELETQKKKKRMIDNRQNINDFITEELPNINNKDKRTKRTIKYLSVLNKLIERNSNRATTQQYSEMRQSILKTILNSGTKSKTKLKSYRTSKPSIRKLKTSVRTITPTQTKLNRARANKIASKRANKIASNGRKYLA